MPITQDRHIALLRAAAELRRALDTVKSQVENAATRHARGEAEAKDLFIELSMVVEFQAVVPNYRDIDRLIDAELIHFRHNYARNRRAARKAEARRRAQGIPTAPIPRPSEVTGDSMSPVERALQSAFPRLAPQVTASGELSPGEAERWGWWNEGALARGRGFEASTCPYEPGTEAERQWHDGWRGAGGNTNTNTNTNTLPKVRGLELEVDPRWSNANSVEGDELSEVDLDLLVPTQGPTEAR